MSKELNMEDAYACIGKLTIENEKLKSEKAKYWEWYLEERTSIHRLEDEIKVLKEATELSQTLLEELKSTLKADLVGPGGSIEAAEELLKFIPKENLRAYLPEGVYDQHIAYSEKDDEPGAAGDDFDADIKKEINDNLD